MNAKNTHKFATMRAKRASVSASFDMFKGVVALMLCLALFVVGCTPDQTAGTQTQDTQTQQDQTPTAETQGAQVIANTTRSEQEQTDDRIAEAILNGVYTEERSYAYHSGVERIIVSVTFENDVIVDASIEGIDSHPTSARYITGVNNELASLVVGKTLAEVDIPTRVSGSSLTTAAFKEYLDEIGRTA